jgi:uncharacterized membrane protein YcaP (DUF421 family)
MGKRQIGEMEPFELVITLVIAELACISMADKSIPLSFGIVAIFAVFLIHQLIMLITQKSLKMQQLISGKPTLVLDKNGIKATELKSLDMRTSDLLQSLRTAGYFSISQVAYALFETSGQISVIPFPPGEVSSATLPVPVIVDGQWVEDDIKSHNFNKEPLEKLLSKSGCKQEKLMLVTLDEEGGVLIQEENKPYFTAQIAKEDVYNE